MQSPGRGYGGDIKEPSCHEDMAPQRENTHGQFHRHGLCLLLYSNLSFQLTSPLRSLFSRCLCELLAPCEPVFFLFLFLLNCRSGFLSPVKLQGNLRPYVYFSAFFIICSQVISVEHLNVSYTAHGGLYLTARFKCKTTPASYWLSQPFPSMFFNILRR